MTREDLFAAIGEVESSRLQRSELTMQEPSGVLTKEEPVMKKKSVSVGRIVRNLAAAVVIVSMLGITAYAVVGYVIFDSPQEMLTAVFGDQTGYDHAARGEILDKDGNVLAVQPRYDRVPADEDVIEQEAAPLVSPVGQSISWKGYTLTIDANLYDSVTKCGLLTYTLENPEGVDYSLQSNGEVWYPNGELVSFGQYGYSYIIQDKSTATKLTATFYYQLRNEADTDLEISFQQWAAITLDEYKQLLADTKAQLKLEISEEEVIEYQKELLGDGYAEYEANFSRDEIIEYGYDGLVYEKLGLLEEENQFVCPDKITIPEQAQGKMTNITLGEGAVTLSPIAITVKVEEIENFPNSFIDLTKIKFADGTEYVVKDNYILNYVFAVADSETEETTFMFNRIIDVKEVVSVIVDGDIELTVDKT